jgi:hypothetical protein
MEYKQIFKDSRNSDNGYQSYKVTVFQPEESRFPFMYQIQSGDLRYEDWNTEYQLKQFLYNGTARAIRYAINLIDTYIFTKEVEIDEHKETKPDILCSRT